MKGAYASPPRDTTPFLSHLSLCHCRLALLAAEAGLSRFHFLRAFKAATQLPPYAYRLQRQLQMARRLIMAGHAIADAAHLAGFADQSHLTRRFVSAYGLTPGSLSRSRQARQLRATG